MRTRFMRRLLAIVTLAAAAATLTFTGARPAAATNEFPAHVSIGDIRFFEGTINGGTTWVSFPVTVSNNPGTTVVSWTTVDGGGCSGFCIANAYTPSDYAASSGNLSFSGDGTKQAWVRVMADSADEFNEYFRVKLTSASGFSSIVDDTGVATIMDDDGPPKLNILDAKVVEGTGGGYSQAFVKLVISKQVASDVKVDFDLFDGTATKAGSDYNDTTGSITLAANTGATQMWVYVNRDNACEADETMKVKIFNPPSGVVIADGTSEVTIGNDDWFC